MAWERGSYAGLIAAIMLSLGAAACGGGGASFADGKGARRIAPAGKDDLSPPSADATAVPGPASAADAPATPSPQAVAETRALDWYWPCAQDESPPAPTQDDATVITGGGDFILPPSPGGTSLAVHGRLCNPGIGPRDVVFVIDVSESMRNLINLGNDPLKSGTCGRNEAVKAVLAGLPADTRVALVTFAGGVRTDSGGFMAPGELAAKYGSADILCDRAGTGTDYTAALTRTLALLAGGRPDASHEVYFVSDGEPGSAAANGVDAAAQVRETATIATLMLKGDEAFLENKIASRDAAGVPLHAKVDAAEDLASTLAGLANVHLTSALVRFGDGAQGAQLIEVPVDLTKASTFALPPVSLDPAHYPNGFTFTLETLDSRGVKGGGTGRVLWQ